MKLLKKITAKDVLGPVIALVKELKIGVLTDAYAVAGIAKGYETGVSTYGEWVRFSGDFQATNYLTGEVCRAAKAHVPEVLQDAIMVGLGELEGVIQSTPGGNITKYQLNQPIEFAFKVAIRRNENNEDGSISYEYVTTPLVEMAENDSLSHLTKLLEAPKKEAPKVNKKVASK